MARRFQTLLLDLLPQLRGYALTLTRNSNRADDLVQETAFKALRAEVQFAEETNFPAWCFTIMRNTHLTEARRHQRMQPEIFDIPEQCLAREPDQDTHVLARETLAKIRSLPRRDQDVLIAIARDELSHQQSAMRLNCNVGTVKSRLSRARPRLATLLNEGGRRAGTVFSPIPKRSLIAIKGTWR